MIDGTQTAKTSFQSAELTLRNKYLNNFLKKYTTFDFKKSFIRKKHIDRK